VIGPLTPLRAREGFTIIEVLVAMLVLAVGVMGAVALLDRANGVTTKTRAREAGTNLARELVEASRSVPYDKLSAPITATLQGFSGLGDDRPLQSGWQVERRGRLYTVTATVCTVDDTKDGVGDHSLGNPADFCAAPGGTATDTNPEDYKRVRVQASWNVDGVERDVHQTALINNPGSAGGPAVLGVVAQSPIPVTDETQTAIVFDATVSSVPKTVSWLVDGAVKGEAAKDDAEGFRWTFTWDLGTAGEATAVEDGPYLVGAEAFDAYGVSGPSRSLTVTINRTRPTTPTGLAGGWSGENIALEWLPNPERDVIGYEVWRSTDPDLDGAYLEDAQRVCGLELVLSCVDTTEKAAGQTYYYVVRAFDRDASDLPRANAADHAPLTVVPNDRRPNAVVLDPVARDADGNAVLTWEAPAAASPPYDCEAIDFYRIYRDQPSFEGRYTRVDAGDGRPTFTDTRTDGLVHQYWVTAVDSCYAESQLSNGATG